MTDGYQTITAANARGNAAGTTGVFVGRLAKNIIIGTSAAGGLDKVTLPLNPILGREYPIQVSAVASPVLLYAAAVGTDVTSTINDLATGAALSIPGGSRVSARCVSKNYTTGHAWLVQGSDSSVGAITAAVTLTASQSGKTFVVSRGGAYSINLPVASPGLRFRFVHDLASTANVVTFTPNAAETITGSIINLNAAAPTTISKAGGANITFTAVAAVGSWIEFIGGTGLWLICGCGIGAGAAFA